MLNYIVAEENRTLTENGAATDIFRQYDVLYRNT